MSERHRLPFAVRYRLRSNDPKYLRKYTHTLNQDMLLASHALVHLLMLISIMYINPFIQWLNYKNLTDCQRNTCLSCYSIFIKTLNWSFQCWRSLCSVAVMRSTGVPPSWPLPGWSTSSYTKVLPAPPVGCLSEFSYFRHLNCFELLETNKQKS